MIKLERVTAYTVDEVAEMLHLSRYAIYKFIKIGKFKAQKIGNRYYITDRIVEEFVTGSPVVSSDKR